VNPEPSLTFGRFYFCIRRFLESPSNELPVESSTDSTGCG
jgi:hypothetical protein